MSTIRILSMVLLYGEASYVDVRVAPEVYEESSALVRAFNRQRSGPPYLRMRAHPVSTITEEYATGRCDVMLRSFELVRFELQRLDGPEGRAVRERSLARKVIALHGRADDPGLPTTQREVHEALVPTRALGEPSPFTPFLSTTDKMGQWAIRRKVLGGLLLTENIERHHPYPELVAKVAETPDAILAAAWLPDEPSPSGLVPLTLTSWKDEPIPPPTLATVASGEYPFTERFRLFAEQPDEGVVGEFVDFVQSEEGRAILHEHRLVPESLLTAAKPDERIAVTTPEPTETRRPVAAVPEPVAKSTSPAATPAVPPPANVPAQAASGTSLGEIVFLVGFLAVLGLVFATRRRPRES